MITGKRKYTLDLDGFYENFAEQLRTEPVIGEKDIVTEENKLFGIWKDRNDMMNVEQYIRDLRRGRNFIDGKSGFTRFCEV